MKYQIVGGAGLHRSETKTVDMMVKQLPDSWFGYAGLVVTDSQGSMEIDMKWFTEFGHLNRGDMLTSEQHRCHNE
ncbi:hypothetical protein, partial [Salmonella enterica]